MSWLNSRVGKTYSAIRYNFKRIAADEFDVNGVRVYLSMDGNWQSNPTINDPAFKHQVTKFINRLKKCDVDRVCNPVDEFDMIERCQTCGILK